MSAFASLICSQSPSVNSRLSLLNPFVAGSTIPLLSLEGHREPFFAPQQLSYSVHSELRIPILKEFHTFVLHPVWSHRRFAFAGRIPLGRYVQWVPPSSLGGKTTISAVLSESTQVFYLFLPGKVAIIVG